MKKFGHRPKGDLSRFYRDDARCRRRGGRGAGSQHGGPAQGRAARFIRAAIFSRRRIARHIPIVINSDAHAPEEVAYEFDRAYKLVREVGYTEVMRFEKRKAIPVEIG